jgi:endonuclease YncB( thermonuclease family)
VIDGWRWRFPGTVARIIDGDTLTVRFDLGFRVEYVTPVRMVDVLAPEVVGASRAAGLRAKARLEELLPVGTPVIVETFKNPTDKYGRYLGRVWLGTRDINSTMIDWLHMEGP